MRGYGFIVDGEADKHYSGYRGLLEKLVIEPPHTQVLMLEAALKVVVLLEEQRSFFRITQYNVHAHNTHVHSPL